MERTITDDHAGMGHYGFMAAFSFTVIGAGLLAILRPDGWRLTAWSPGSSGLPRVASVLYSVSSSLSLPWDLAAMAWGAGFVAAAELTQGAEVSTLLGLRGAVSKSERA